MKKDLRDKKIQTNRGQAMMIAVMFFLAGSLIVLGGAASPVLKDIKTVRNLEKSKQSNYLSESGVEDVVYRIKNSMSYSREEYLSVNGVTATTTNQVVSDKREVTAIGDKDSIKRVIKAIVSEAVSTESFNYVLQVGSGSTEVNDDAFIKGDSFSNVAIIGENDNEIDGDAVSAGPNGLIDNMYIKGDAYAHTITNSIIDGDAYYQVISDTTVGGTSYPGSPDQPFGTQAITDSEIEVLKTEAQNGGTISSPCPYVINSNTTIGPKKINCDLEIINSAEVTLNGHVWVVGDIDIRNSAKVKINPSLGSESLAIIADNPSDRQGSGVITIKNSTQFEGSGTDGSYVIAISQNNDAEGGGGEEAIEVKNNANGDLFVYAAYGRVYIKNSASLQGAAGYEVEIKNDAHIDGDTDIINLPGSSGGGDGGFDIESWLEI